MHKKKSSHYAKETPTISMHCEKFGKSRVISHFMGHIAMVARGTDFTDTPQ